MWVKTKTLPDSLRNALIELGHHRDDVEVKASTTYSLSPDCVNDGERGFCSAVNLSTGERKTAFGAWGGANAFEVTIDRDDATRDIPQSMAIIKGAVGNRVSARILVNPDTLVKMLPSPAIVLTQNETVTLHTIKAYKSSYRLGEAERYGVTPAEFMANAATLAAKGLVKITKVGTSITTEGKNALPPSLSLPFAWLKRSY